MQLVNLNEKEFKTQNVHKKANILTNPRKSQIGTCISGIMVFQATESLPPAADPTHECSICPEETT